MSGAADIWRVTCGDPIGDLRLPDGDRAAGLNAGHERQTGCCGNGGAAACRHPSDRISGARKCGVPSELFHNGTADAEVRPPPPEAVAAPSSALPPIWVWMVTDRGRRQVGGEACSAVLRRLLALSRRSTHRWDLQDLASDAVHLDGAARSRTPRIPRSRTRTTSRRCIATSGARRGREERWCTRSCASGAARTRRRWYVGLSRRRSWGRVRRSAGSGRSCARGRCWGAAAHSPGRRADPHRRSPRRRDRARRRRDLLAAAAR
jgi:hypothetical protein